MDGPGTYPDEETLVEAMNRHVAVLIDAGRVRYIFDPDGEAREVKSSISSYFDNYRLRRGNTTVAGWDVWRRSPNRRVIPSTANVRLSGRRKVEGKARTEVVAAWDDYVTDRNRRAKAFAAYASDEDPIKWTASSSPVHPVTDLRHPTWATFRWDKTGQTYSLVSAKPGWSMWTGTGELLRSLPLADVKTVWLR